ncbi:pentapeptide repeat-containing protein [Secundilactobacillus folii]|uniref:Quinolone resistance protein n=1 Tax=Secundilactobacillus folii TaxID=2678357 RepID=A0A7X2XW37_9LACO|nr:pentapeptide repeat-containing protein [Secundilactobacillus folii]MTV82691.1 hypothetical protein [Secundilactobacillus folii]
MTIQDQTLAFDAIVEGEQYENCTFTPSNQKIAVSAVPFTKCRFEQTDFTGGEWLDCHFQNTNFANCTFAQSIMYRDTFQDCSLMGANFIDNRWKDNAIINCQAEYANFSNSQMTHCRAENTSFKEAYFRDITFKQGFVMADCVLDETSFLGTKLKGLNVSDSEVDSLELLPQDLPGLVISAYQAPVLAELLGVKVK